MNDAVPAGVIPGFTSTMATVDGVRLHYWIGGDPKVTIPRYGVVLPHFAWR